MEQKIDAQHARQDVADQAMKDLAARLSKVEERSTTASSTGEGGIDMCRKLTLIIGGLERDTKKSFILKTVKGVLSKIDMQQALDEESFLTGPRSSIALLPFRVRVGKSSLMLKPECVAY